MLTGVLCATWFGDTGFGAGNESIADQLLAQSVGVVATLVYTFIVSFSVLTIINELRRTVRPPRPERVRNRRVALRTETTGPEKGRRRLQGAALASRMESGGRKQARWARGGSATPGKPSR